MKRQQDSSRSDVRKMRIAPRRAGRPWDADGSAWRNCSSPQNVLLVARRRCNCHALFAVAVGLCAAASSAAPVDAQQQPPSPVVVATVVEREVAAGQTLLGTVMPRRKSVVGSAVDGRVVEFLVNDGEWVIKGQPIAQLLTATIEIEVAVAKADLTLREQELAELQVSLPEQIVQAQSELTRSKALLDYARSKLDRTQQLFQKGTTITVDELDEARSLFLAAEQVRARAQSALTELNQTRDQRIAQARARILVQQETVNLLEDRLAKYTIRAPFDGYVTAKYTEVGDWISQGDPAAEVMELDPVEVSVAVPEIHIAVLSAANAASRSGGGSQPLEVQVHLDAAPGQVFTGQVARIVPYADPRTRSFPVKVLLKNPGEPGSHLLMAGMLANVMLPVGGRQQALLVPKDALVLGGRSPQVMAVVEDAKSKQTVVQPVAVELGVAEGSLIQVKGQLRAGQQVVVRGNERLLPGQPISIVGGEN